MVDKFGKIINSTFVQLHWDEFQEIIGCCGWNGSMKLSPTCQEPDCTVIIPDDRQTSLIILEVVFLLMGILFLSLSCCAAVRMSRYYYYYKKCSVC